MLRCQRNAVREDTLKQLAETSSAPKP